MQRFFPGLLDALLADHVGAAVVAQLAGALQILDVAVGDAADVTNHVGGRQACGYSRTQRARSSTPGNWKAWAANQAASVSFRLLRSCRLA